MRKNNWACFLLILAGIVIGGFIGSLLSGYMVKLRTVFWLIIAAYIGFGNLKHYVWAFYQDYDCEYLRYCGCSRYLSIYLR